MAPRALTFSPPHCPVPGGQATPLASHTPSKLAYGWASPAKLTVVATMMMMIPMTIKTMLSSRARRPSLRAPSTSPCCTLLRDYRERVAETSGWLSLAAPWGPLRPSFQNTPHRHCSLQSSSCTSDVEASSSWRSGQDSRGPDLLWGPLTKPSPCWLGTAGSRTKQRRTTEPQGSTVETESLRRWTGSRPC